MGIFSLTWDYQTPSRGFGEHGKRYQGNIARQSKWIETLSTFSTFFNHVFGTMAFRCIQASGKPSNPSNPTNNWYASFLGLTCTRTRCWVLRGASWTADLACPLHQICWEISTAPGSGRSGMMGIYGHGVEGKDLSGIYRLYTSFHLFSSLFF